MAYILISFSIIEFSYLFRQGTSLKKRLAWPSADPNSIPEIIDI